MKYAIIHFQGKQMKVAVGDTIVTDLVAQKAGETVTADKVLLISDGENITVGQPFVQNATVSLEVVEHGHGPKIRVATYTAKSRHRKVHGHKQDLSSLKVVKILSK